MSLQAAIFKPDWHQVFDGKASAVCGPTVELQIQKLKCVNTKTDTNTIFVGDPSKACFNVSMFNIANVSMVQY